MNEPEQLPGCLKFTEHGNGRQADENRVRAFLGCQGTGGNPIAAPVCALMAGIRAIGGRICASVASKLTRADAAGRQARIRPSSRIVDKSVDKCE